MTPEEIAERAARGAAWLDAVYPEWWTHIDLAELDLADSCRCVIGQIGGGDIEFFYDIEALFEESAPDFLVAHGFNFSYSASSWSAWAALDEAWIVETKIRAEVGAL